MVDKKPAHMGISMDLTIRNPKIMNRKHDDTQIGQKQWGKSTGFMTLSMRENDEKAKFLSHRNGQRWLFRNQTWGFNMIYPLVI
jgi:hypothetical protein